MTELASSLLDFILDLLRDSDAAGAFQADPEQALADAGLGDVCAADLDAILPMVSDFTVASVGSAALAASSPAVAAATHVAGAVRSTDVSPATLPDTTPDTVIESLKFIQNNFTYTETHTTAIDASHSVWAGGDANLIFGDDAVLATGGSVAAGDDVEDVEVDNSVEDSYNDNSTEVEGIGNAVGEGAKVEDAFNTDIDLENSGNTQTGNGNVQGEDNEVDLQNSGNSVEGSVGVNIGEDNEVGDVAAGRGNAVGNTDNSDNSVEVEVEDAFNDNSDNSVEVEVEDAFNDNSDNSVEIDDVEEIEGSVGG